MFPETHLDPSSSNDNLFLSDMYDDPYRKDRTNHGGGLLKYLNTDLVHTRGQDLETYCEESIWVEIKITNLACFTVQELQIQTSLTA